MKKIIFIVLFMTFSVIIFGQSNSNIEYDMLLGTIRNPHATTYDFISNGFKVENTQLLSKSEYRNKKSIKKEFTDRKGNFDETSFQKTYEKAKKHYQLMGDPAFLKNINEVKYSPFDVTRPRNSKVWDASVIYKETKKSK